MAFILFLLFSFSSHSIDLGFRHQSGFCHKKRRPGFNPDFLGECGNLTGLKVVNYIFKKQTFKGATFNSSYIYATRFEGINTAHMALRRATVLQSQFFDVDSPYLDVRGSIIKAVDFAGANLKNMIANGTRFEKTNFRDCNLQGADFWGSNLQEVSFDGSDLRNANLTNTHILFTSFKNAKFNQKTRLPFSREEAIQRGMIAID